VNTAQENVATSRNEDATTTEPGASEPEIQIRTARHVWIPPLVFGTLWLVMAIGQVLLGHGLFAAFWVVVGCASLYQGLRSRTLGIDLTPEFAEIRSLRRRRIAWGDVQAVVRHRRQGALQVQLILENGSRENLRAPTTLWNFGGAQYERDFNVISQWWLAHGGPSWSPDYPAAPKRPDSW
jgi:hypothetical protein